MEFFLQQFILAADPPLSVAATTAVAATYGSVAENQTRLFSAQLDVPTGLGYWVVQARSAHGLARRRLLPSARETLRFSLRSCGSSAAELRHSC